MGEGKVDLNEAGIGEGISEVIVTTESAAGITNAAPIGITTTIEGGEKKYFVKLYKGSQTLANVLETHTLAANVTCDAVLFVNAAFEKVDESRFTDFEGVSVLTEANAWIVFTSLLVEKSSAFLRFQLKPRAVKINKKEVKAINRALNAVIEAAILATRFEIITDELEREELKRMMEQYAEIIQKCGGHQEKEAMGILTEKCKGLSKE